jgi:hypothetical protein
MTYILDQLLNALAWFYGVFYKVINYALDGLILILKSVLWLVMSGLLTAIQGIIDGISYSSVAFQWAAAYSAIPPQAVYVMSRIGLPEFITIVGGAYAVRLALNLIPSWATRA